MAVLANLSHTDMVAGRPAPGAPIRSVSGSLRPSRSRPVRLRSSGVRLRSRSGQHGPDRLPLCPTRTRHAWLSSGSGRSGSGRSDWAAQSGLILVNSSVLGPVRLRAAACGASTQSDSETSCPAPGLTGPSLIQVCRAYGPDRLPLYPTRTRHSQLRLRPSLALKAQS